METQIKKTEFDGSSIVKLEQLRAEIWKQALLASDETSLVQNLLDKAGPVLNCENVSFMPYDEKLKEIVVLQQWRSDGSDIGLGEVVPKWIFKRFIGRPYIQLLFDELPAWLKPVMKIFEKKYGTRSTLVIPYGDARHPEGYISINHYLYPKRYSEKEIELFRELSQIIHLRSKQLKSQTALQQERDIFVSGSVVVFKRQNRENWPVEYTSENVQHILGFAADDFLSGKIHYANLVHPEDISRVAEEIETHSQKGARHFEHQPYRLIHQKGEVVWVLDYVTILRNNAGDITHYLGYVVDITDRKQVEQTLEQRVREMELLQTTVLEIVAPHEISNLLYTIIERAAELLDADSGGMYLCYPESKEVRCVVSFNTLKDYAGVTLQYGEGAAGYVAQTGKPLIVDDYHTWSGCASVFDKEKPFERLVSAPMIWQGQVIGVIHVMRSEADSPFAQSELELLSYFANHAAIAVANARQLDSLQTELTERKRVEEKLDIYASQMTLLNKLTRSALKQSEPNETYQMLADRIGELLDADGAYITLWDSELQRTIPVTAYGPMREKYSALQIEPGELTLTESVLQTGQALAVEDVSNTPFLSPRIAAMFPDRSLLALPMIADSQKLGAVLVAFNNTHRFSREEISFGKKIAQQVALVVARIRTQQETERLAQEHSLLFRATRDFTAGLDEERVLAAIVQHMTAALNVDGCTISRYEPEQDCIVTMLDYDNVPGYHPEPIGTQHMLAAYPETRRVLESRQPLIVFSDDPTADEAELTVLEKYGYTTVLMLPLAVGERISGLVELSRRSDVVPFSKDEIQLAQNLASTASVALENGRLHAEVQSLAITDSLTSLPNRRAFDRTLDQEINRATRYGHPLALLFLDIDSFKIYNDTYGHPAGDERLKAIARLFHKSIRHPDMVARYGGEEFAIILPYTTKISALTTAERLRFASEEAYYQASSRIASHREMIPAAGHQPVPGYTVSIGVAVYPEDAQTAEELLHAADEAALAAKRQGKNCVCVAPVSPTKNL